MIIDTSAIIAILRGEPEEDRFTDLLLTADHPRISAATLFETRLVALAYRGLRELSDLLGLISPTVLPVDEHQAALAFEAFQKFGKGRHPAGLNFGDCFAYAAARALDEPLLFKGDDFGKTDVRVADQPGEAE